MWKAVFWIFYNPAISFFLFGSLMVAVGILMQKGFFLAVGAFIAFPALVNRTIVFLDWWHRGGQDKTLKFIEKRAYPVPED